jgi:pimeloyl-ACP methyl ester carboxylesterase
MRAATRGQTSRMNAEFAVRRFRLHGHDLAYRRAGTGPAVLLVHGMAGSSRTWKDVMPRLAERCDVIAPDLLGHGDSDTPPGDYSLGGFAASLRDLLGGLDVEHVTVVGQSLGGGVAMQLAYQHPEVVERLVLVCSGGLGREVNWMLRALAFPGAEYVAPVIFPEFVKRLGDGVSRTVGRFGVRAPRAAEMWNAYSSLTEPAHRAAFLRTLRAVVEVGGQSVSANDRLYLASAMPTLIVWGDADPIIPVSHAHAAHEAIAGSRLEILPGVGHFPQAEAPELLTRLLLEFMQTPPATAGAEHFRALLRDAATA